MCGGAPKPAPQRKEAPPPEPPPELVLDQAGQQAEAARSRKSKNRTGRAALVTPGLALGKAAGRAVGSGLGLGSAGRGNR